MSSPDQPTQPQQQPASSSTFTENGMLGPSASQINNNNSNSSNTATPTKRQQQQRSPPGAVATTTVNAGLSIEAIPAITKQGIQEAMQHLDRVGLSPRLAGESMVVGDHKHHRHHSGGAGSGEEEQSSSTSSERSQTPSDMDHENDHHEMHRQNHHDAQGTHENMMQSMNNVAGMNANSGNGSQEGGLNSNAGTNPNSTANNSFQASPILPAQQIPNPETTTSTSIHNDPNNFSNDIPSSLSQTKPLVDGDQQQQQGVAPTPHHGGRHFRKAASAIMANLRSSKNLWDNTGAAKPLSRQNAMNPLQVMHESLHKLLWNVPHVNVLTPDELRSLNVLIREYGVMDVVMDRGTEIQHVYALISGSVEVFDNRNSRHMEKRVGSINAPNLFGMDGIVFDQPCQFAMRAGDKAMMVLIPKQDFLRCIASNKQFAHSLTRPIVENMGLFGVFQDFIRAVFTTTSDVAAASDGTCLNLTAILAAYRKLNNVIHPFVNEPDIDVGGWLYASRRLPENVAESLVINLARALPPFLAQDLRQHVQEGSTTGDDKKKKKGESEEESMTSVKYIVTHDRRRCSWQIGNKGHTFVLLRESYTDVLDFITCMCIHIVESQKLRQRLRSMVGGRAIDVLHHAVTRWRKLDRSAPDFAAESARVTDEALARLPLNEVEVQGLKRIWPSNCLSTIYEMFLHREEYMITLDIGNLGRFDVDPYVRWALSLRRHLLNSIGLSEVDEIPSDVTIDVLSSNTHSTKNCICSSIRKNAQKIEEWGAANIPAIANLDWFNRNDFLFLAWAKMIGENPDLRREYRSQLIADGFTIIEDSAMTGLQVDIVDLATVDADNVDPVLQPAAQSFKKAFRESPRPSRCFLLNMDFAFGAQADYITHALILAFGRSIRSFNVMGKAGALVGDRGDVQLPTSIVFSKSALGEDSTDENRSCGNEDLLPSRLRELSGPNREVHVGPVLTIPGTLLQNEKLLRFYRTVIGCVGLEMEGTYFARQLEEAIETNLLSKFARRRFAYYTSDLPLRTQSASLSKPLAPNEGIPPMYSITRAMLERIFIDCAERQIKFPDNSSMAQHHHQQQQQNNNNSDLENSTRARSHSNSKRTLDNATPPSVVSGVNQSNGATPDSSNNNNSNNNNNSLQQQKQQQQPPYPTISIERDSSPKTASTSDDQTAAAAVGESSKKKNKNEDEERHPVKEQAVVSSDEPPMIGGSGGASAKKRNKNQK